MVSGPPIPTARWLNVIFPVYAILVVPASSVAAQSETRDSPRIKIVEPHHDLGRLMATDPVEHTFEVRNEGGDALIIEQVKSGSGTGRASFDREIPPGGTGHIKVSVESRRVHGRFAMGWLVRSNDPVQPEVRVEIKGEMSQYFDFRPTGRVFLEGGLNVPVEKTVTVVPYDGDPHFKILGLSSNIDHLIAYEFGEGKSGGEWVIHVRKKVPARVAEPTYGTIEVTTNEPEQPVRRLQIVVVNEGPVTVQPRHLNFGTVDTSRQIDWTRTLERTLLVQCDDCGLEITGWELNNDHFIVAIEELVAGSRYEAKVRLRPDFENTLLRPVEVGQLSLFTNLPEQPEVTVRIVARFRIAEGDR